MEILLSSQEKLYYMTYSMSTFGKKIMLKGQLLNKLYNNIHS